MGILTVTVTHSGFKDIPTKLKRVQSDSLALMSELAKQLFSEWMAPWDRVYPIEINFKKSDTVVTNISNTGGTGSSGWDDRPARDNVPSYINYGAKRYAVMSKAFSPKTAAGLIASGSGSGGFIDLTAEVQGYIAPRKIDETVADELDEEFEQAIDEVWGNVFG